MHTCLITDGVDIKSIIVPDEVGIIMNGRVIKSEFHFIFNQYWSCKKLSPQPDSNRWPKEI